MNVATLAIDKSQARALYREYKAHREFQTKEDRMYADNNWHARAASKRVMLPPRTFPEREKHGRAEAILPLIPVNLRPRTAMETYHILWEAEWSRVEGEIYFTGDIEGCTFKQVADAIESALLLNSSVTLSISPRGGPISIKRTVNVP